ncbi:MAG: TolC family protein [Elusimicrobiota bacterium]|nr:TolC family protein [Elusimicrobiota bacterium]
MLRFLSAVFLCWTAVPSRAQAPDLTLPAVLEAARRDAPSVRAAAMHRDAERALVKSEATPEKPMLELERMRAPIGGSPLAGPERTWSVSQQLPFPTALFYRGRAASFEADAAAALHRRAVVEASARAREAYADLYEAERSLIFLDEIVDLLRRFSRVAEAKYAAGKGTQTDALKAQLELTRMLNEKALASAAVAGARAALNAAMGREEDAPLPALAPPASAPPSASWTELRALALAENPGLAAAAGEAGKARAELGMKRSEWLPDVTLRYRRRAENGMRSHDASLGLSLPVWFWKQAGTASHAGYEARYAEALRDGEKLDLLAALRGAHASVLTESRLREAYRTTVIPQAESALRSAEAAYQSDRAGFLDLLDAGRSLITARLESVRHDADLERALAALSRAVGRETVP